MARRTSRVVEVEVGKRTAYFTGTGVGAVMDALNVPRMRCPYTRRACCPVDRADDVITYIEHRQRRVVTVVPGAS